MEEAGGIEVEVIYSQQTLALTGHVFPLSGCWTVRTGELVCNRRENRGTMEHVTPILGQIGGLPLAGLADSTAVYQSQGARKAGFWLSH